MLTLLITSCSGSKIITLATQGTLSKENFNTEIPFYYIGKHMYIDVVINQKTYTFLYDTGWDITHIDKSLLGELSFSSIKKHKASGSSFEEENLQYGTLSNSLIIGGISFQNIGAGIQDMTFLKSTFSDQRKIYGIIGTNILRKAFWRIDYNKQTLSFSNKIESFPLDSNAIKVDMIPKSSSNWGLNRIKLTINGVTDNFVFDTGSYGGFSANEQFFERLKNTGEKFVEISSNVEPQMRKYKVDKLEMDPLELKNQELLIEEDIDLLIGNDFLEEYIVTIDWLNNRLYLQE